MRPKPNYLFCRFTLIVPLALLNSNYELIVALDAIILADDSLYQFLSCLGLSDSICFDGATVNNESFFWSHFSLYYIPTSLCTLSLLVDVKPLRNPLI